MKVPLEMLLRVELLSLIVFASITMSSNNIKGKTRSIKIDVTDHKRLYVL